VLTGATLDTLVIGAEGLDSAPAACKLEVEVTNGAGAEGVED
jgi:hypothetical protein